MVACDVITTGLWFTVGVETIVRRGNDVSDKVVVEVAQCIAGDELLLRTVILCVVVVVVVACDVITTGLWFTVCVEIIARCGNDVGDKAVEEVATLLLCSDCLDFDFATAFIRKTDNAPCNVVPKVYVGEPFALILLRRFTNGVDDTV